jgi:LmbE family N-acetylglucosaminyl deacetylase
MQNILVIAPHPDDESIGCGGALCLHKQRNDYVRVVVLTSGERGLPELEAKCARNIREAEARAAAMILGVDQIDFLRLPDLALLRNIGPAAHQLAELLDTQMPDVIYLPHPEESHIDHMAAVPMIRLGLRRTAHRARTPVLRAYEVWTPMRWYNTVHDITTVMDQKLRAIRCHKSQIRAYRHDDAAAGLARYRGVMSNTGKYAEVYWELAPSALNEWARQARMYWKMPSRLLSIRQPVLKLRNWLRP